ncbi:hypothetical protein C8Q77DRAFT_282745 [Trametes polyzona]|nr:hypothetical protein C8Q77DRAFT_282745 [Trametes polyzona]
MFRDTTMCLSDLGIDTPVLDQITEVMGRLEVLNQHIIVGRGPPIDRAVMDAFDSLLARTSDTVKTYLNASAPIHRLPSEILAEIFGLACSTPLCLRYPLVLHRTFYSVRLLRTVVMAVCRTWRDIAISTSFLWSDIAFLPGEHNGSPIQCSRTLGSLMNIYHDTNLGSQTCLSVLTQHGDRVRTLHIRDVIYPRPKPRRSIEISPYLPLVSPSIEELVLFFDPSMDPSPVSARPLFSGSAPRLRFLALFETRLFPTDHFPNLRRLHLDMAFRGYASTTTIHTMLQNTPQLEEAYLGAKLIRDLAPGHGVVPLSRLRKMTLYLDYYPDLLLRAIAFPPHCLICIHCTVVDMVPECIAALSESLDVSLLTRLSLRHDVRSVWPWVPSLLLTLSDTSARYGVVLSVSHMMLRLQRQQAREIFCSLFRTSPLYANVRELTIFNYRELVNSEFLNSLRCLETITHIFLGDCPKATATKRSKRFPVLARTSGSGELIAQCPDLTTLYFILCRPQQLRDARKIVEARRRAGRPIQRLGLVCSGRYPGQIRALSDLVDELDVSYDLADQYRYLQDDSRSAEGQDRSVQAGYHWPPRWPDRQDALSEPE